MQIELLPDNTSKLIILTAAFVSLSLFAVLRHISSKYFVDMLHASVSGKKFEQLYLDNNVIVIKSDWIFAIITIINFGLVSFEFFNYKQVSITNNLISDFAVILAFVVLFFLLKYVFSFIIGFSFIETEYIKKYFYNVLTIYRALAMISFPLIIAIPFLSDSYLIYLFISLISLFFISQILIFIRVFKTSNKTKFSILHMFLYLCTLEIVPVLFIGKISGLFS